MMVRSLLRCFAPVVLSWLVGTRLPVIRTLAGLRNLDRSRTRSRSAVFVRAVAQPPRIAGAGSSPPAAATTASSAEGDGAPETVAQGQGEVLREDEDGDPTPQSRTSPVHQGGNDDDPIQGSRDAEDPARGDDEGDPAQDPPSPPSSERHQILADRFSRLTLTSQSGRGAIDDHHHGEEEPARTFSEDGFPFSLRGQGVTAENLRAYVQVCPESVASILHEGVRTSTSCSGGGTTGPSAAGAETTSAPETRSFLGGLFRGGRGNGNSNRNAQIEGMSALSSVCQNVEGLWGEDVWERIAVAEVLLECGATLGVNTAHPSPFYYAWHEDHMLFPRRRQMSPPRAQAQPSRMQNFPTSTPAARNRLGSRGPEMTAGVSLSTLESQVKLPAFLLLHGADLFELFRDGADSLFYAGRDQHPRRMIDTEVDAGDWVLTAHHRTTERRSGPTTSTTSPRPLALHAVLFNSGGPYGGELFLEDSDAEGESFFERATSSRTDLSTEATSGSPAASSSGSPLLSSGRTPAELRQLDFERARFLEQEQLEDRDEFFSNDEETTPISSVPGAARTQLYQDQYPDPPRHHHPRQHQSQYFNFHRQTVESRDRYRLRNPHPLVQWLADLSSVERVRLRLLRNELCRQLNLGESFVSFSEAEKVGSELCRWSRTRGAEAGDAESSTSKDMALRQILLGGATQPRLPPSVERTRAQRVQMERKKMFPSTTEHIPVFEGGPLDPEQETSFLQLLGRVRSVVAAKCGRPRSSHYQKYNDHKNAASCSRKARSRNRAVLTRPLKKRTKDLRALKSNLEAVVSYIKRPVRLWGRGRVAFSSGGTCRCCGQVVDPTEVLLTDAETLLKIVEAAIVILQLRTRAEIRGAGEEA